MKPVSQEDINTMKENGSAPAIIREAEAKLEFHEKGLAVADQIRAAFSGVTLGGGVGLYESRGKDGSKDKKTLSMYRSCDEEDNWQRIPVSDLNEPDGGFWFFDAEGMRFHLPAYLIADLQGKLNFGMEFKLTHFSAHCLSRFELLNSEQRQSVRAFLLHLLDDPEYELDRDSILRALASYWTE